MSEDYWENERKESETAAIVAISMILSEGADDIRDPENVNFAKELIGKLNDKGVNVVGLPGKVNDLYAVVTNQIRGTSGEHRRRLIESSLLRLVVPD